jgi:DNA-binding IclR family transcriptional regulator
MPRGVAILQDLRRAIVNMHSLGVSNTKLVRYTDVPPRTIQSILRHFNEHGDLGGAGKSTGRRCKLSRESYIYIYLILC